MTYFESQLNNLKTHQYIWLITGVAGFIGSNLLETLLLHNQKVVGLDNFATGNKTNLEEVQQLVSKEQWKNFKFIEGDISNYSDCKKSVKKIDFVLHQAALGSVTRSIDEPIISNHVNITGFLNMLTASRDSDVKSFTYAASSSTYGDHPGLPKVEEHIGSPLSPYAVTKYVNELYGEVFSKNYNFNSIGLRYFNVFGKRQDPEGSYAAVIPRWINLMIQNKPIDINGDGETTRDFCFIDNAVQANILSALANKKSKNNIYNVAVNDRTSLNELFNILRDLLLENGIEYALKPNYQDFRLGDVRHSQADTSKAEKLLQYKASDDVRLGLSKTVKWYLAKKD